MIDTCTVDYLLRLSSMPRPLVWLTFFLPPPQISGSREGGGGEGGEADTQLPTATTITRGDQPSKSEAVLIKVYIQHTSQHTDRVCVCV